MSNLIDKIYPILTDPKNDKFVMSINAPWGFGKTYLANELITKINRPSYNQEYNGAIALPIIDLSDYDYVNDPLIPIIVEILNGIEHYEWLSSEKKTEIKKTFKALILTTATALSALDPTGISSAVLKILKETKDELDKEKSNKIEENLESYKSYSEIIKSVSESIKQIAQNPITITDQDGVTSEFPINRIVIFIDNFDRVESKFIFKFLNIIEKLKAQCVTFCLLMNKEQLQNNIYHTIMSKPSVESEHFLEKYIDFEYCLPNVMERTDCINDLICDELKPLLASSESMEFLKGVSIRQLIQVNKLCSEIFKKDPSFRNPFKQQLQEITFLMACFIVTSKNELIPLWYGLRESFIMNSGQLSNKITSAIVQKSRMLNGEERKLHLNENIVFSLGFFKDTSQLYNLFQDIMKILLKEN